MNNNLLVITTYPEKGEKHSAGTIGIAPFAKNTLLSMKKHAKDLKITILGEKLPNHRHSEFQKCHPELDSGSLRSRNKFGMTNGQVRDDKNEYSENGMTIKRLWKRNSWLTFYLLALEILKNYKDTNKVLIQFGLAVYGDIPHLALWIPFLIILKLLGKDTYIVFHEVVTDINKVYGHVNLRPNSLKAKIINIFIRFFYSFSIKLSKKIFVLEEELKENLISLVTSEHSVILNLIQDPIRKIPKPVQQVQGPERIEGQVRNDNVNEKISVIPIGVEEFADIPTKEKARKAINNNLAIQQFNNNDFIILCFGFLAWYKGTDWIVDKLRVESGKLKIKNLKLIIAGGANPNRVNHAFYKKYVEDLEKKCQENGIILTGFVKEEDMPNYFQAADLVVFPYRAFMGSAATLSLAYSFKKPFIVSNALNGIFKTADLKSIMSKFQLHQVPSDTWLRKEDLCFDISENSKSKWEVGSENVEKEVGNGKFISPRTSLIHTPTSNFSHQSSNCSSFPNQFYHKLNKLINNKTMLSKMSKLSAEIANSRNWESIGLLYYKEIFKS